MERHDQTGRHRAGQPADHAEPPAEDLVAGVLLAGQLLPGREDLGRDPREDRDVVAEVVDVADVGQDDDQRRGRMQAKRGRDQPGGRAPGPVDRRRAAVLERREDLGETRGALDLPGQVLELDRRCCRRRDVGWEGSGFARDSGHRIFA